MLRRKGNWDVALVEWGEIQRGLPFIYGVSDCGTLVRGAHQTMYGFDLWPEIPQWNNATGAIRTIVEHGSVSEMLRRKGATSWPTPHMAQSGDVLVMTGDHSPFEESVMVVIGPYALSAHPENGIEQFKLTDVIDGGAEITLHMPFEVDMEVPWVE